jgi:hypothetical protein
MKTRLALFVAFAMVAATSAMAQFDGGGAPPGAEGPTPVVDEYQLDDGFAENSIGLTTGGDLDWVNQFDVIAGAENIGEVAYVWGPIPANFPFFAVIYDDPNNDGSPADVGPADVIYINAEVVITPDTASTFDRYTVASCPSVGAEGDIFFLGVCMQNTVAGDYPAGIDQSFSLGRSWIAGDSPGLLDCTDPGTAGLPWGVIDSYGLAGNWMCRGSSCAPTPTTVTTWGQIKSIYSN